MAGLIDLECLKKLKVPSLVFRRIRGSSLKFTCTHTIAKTLKVYLRYKKMKEQEEVILD